VNTLRLAFGVSILRQQRLTGQLDGIGRYGEELLSALRTFPGCSVQEYAHQDIVSAKAPGALDAGHFRRQFLAATSIDRPFDKTSRVLGASADLVHATDHFIPRLRKLPMVATIHDAIPLSRPEWNRYCFRKLKGMLWKRSAQWADRIITVSEDAKKSITQWFGIPSNRIDVTPLGVGTKWFTVSDKEAVSRVRTTHGLEGGYFLFLGVMQPRKNVGRLIEAHRLLPADLRHKAPLVVAGPPGWNCAKEESALGFGDGGALRQIGQMPEEDLLPLMQGATALVLPSLHEGFGLPVLEAFAAGTPVIASHAGAIPEVAGEAALLVDPLDVSALAEGMRLVACDRSLAQTLRAKGHERARQFTWQRTAELTADVYRKVLSDKPR